MLILFLGFGFNLANLADGFVRKFKLEDVHGLLGLKVIAAGVPRVLLVDIAFTSGMSMVLKHNDNEDFALCTNYTACVPHYPYFNSYYECETTEMVLPVNTGVSIHGIPTDIIPERIISFRTHQARLKQLEIQNTETAFAADITFGLITPGKILPLDIDGVLGLRNKELDCTRSESILHTAMSGDNVQNGVITFRFEGSAKPFYGLSLIVETGGEMESTHLHWAETVGRRDIKLVGDYSKLLDMGFPIESFPLGGLPTMDGVVVNAIDICGISAGPSSQKTNPSTSLWRFLFSVEEHSVIEEHSPLQVVFSTTHRYTYFPVEILEILTGWTNIDCSVVQGGPCFIKRNLNLPIIKLSLGESSIEVPLESLRETSGEEFDRLNIYATPTLWASNPAFNFEQGGEYSAILGVNTIGDIRAAGTDIVWASSINGSTFRIGFHARSEVADGGHTRQFVGCDKNKIPCEGQDTYSVKFNRCEAFQCRKYLFMIYDDEAHACRWSFPWRVVLFSVLIVTMTHLLIDRAYKFAIGIGVYSGVIPH